MEEQRKTENPSEPTITTPHLNLDSFPGTPISTDSISRPSSPPLNSIGSINKESIFKSPRSREPVTVHVESTALKKVNLGAIPRSMKRERIVNMVALGFRVFGAISCLISFSVMAANTNKGWALDSFYHYKEFRYILAVNVIGFMYSAGQAFDSVYYMATAKHVLKHPHRYYFEFAVDQVVTYLLISASSSATTRIDDWKLNWGRDKFPDMATGSVTISFFAFVALAFSTLISGYALCTSKSLQF